MIRKIITYNALAESIRSEIDREIINKMLEASGVDPDEIGIPSDDSPDLDKDLEWEARFVARSINIGTVLSVDRRWNQLDLEFEIEIDENKASSYEERFETIRYELIANEV